MDTRKLITCFQLSILYVLVSCQNDNPRNTVKFVVECESPADNSPSKLVNVEVLSPQNNQSSLLNNPEDNIMEPTYGYSSINSQPPNEQTAENESPSYTPDQESQASKPNLFTNSNILPPIGAPSLLGGKYNQANNQGTNNGNYGQEVQSSDSAMSPSLAYPRKEEVFVGDKRSEPSEIFKGLPNLMPTIFLPPLPIGGMVEELSSLIRNAGESGRPDTGINGIPTNVGGFPDILRNSNAGGLLQNQLTPQSSLINPDGIGGLSSLLNRNSIGQDRIQGNLGESLLSRLRDSNSGNILSNPQESPTLSERLSNILNRNSISGDADTAASNNAIETNPRDAIFTNLRNSGLGNILQQNQPTLPSLTNSPLTERLSNILNRNSISGDADTAASNSAIETNPRDAIFTNLKNSGLGNILQQNQPTLPSLTNSPLTERLSTLLNRNSNTADVNTTDSNDGIRTNTRDSILSILKNSDLRNILQNELALPSPANSTLTERLSALLNKNSNSNDIDMPMNDKETITSPKDSLMSILRNSDLGNKLLNQLNLPSLVNSSLADRLSASLNRNANSDDADTAASNKVMETNPRDSLLSIFKNSDIGNTLLNQLLLPSPTNSTLTERLSSVLNRNSNSDDADTAASNNVIKTNPRDSIVSTLRNSDLGNLLQNQLKFPSLVNSTLTERLSSALNRNSNSDDVDITTDIDRIKTNHRDSIKPIEKNSDLENILQNQLGLPYLPNSTLSDRLSALRKQSNSNDLNSSVNGIQTNLRDSLSAKLKNSSLLTSQSEFASTPRISIEKILLAVNKSKPIDLETSPSLSRSSIIKPPSSLMDSLSLLNRNRNLNNIETEPINNLPLNTNLEIPMIPRNSKILINEDAKPTYSSSYPTVRNPTNRYHIESGIMKPKSIQNSPATSIIKNPSSNNKKPHTFQNLKIHKGQKLKGKNLDQPQFEQGFNYLKPNTNMMPLRGNRFVTPLDKLRNSMLNSRPQLSDMRLPNRIPQRPSIPEFPFSNPNTNPMNRMRSSLDEMFRNDELSKTTNKIINGLTSGMGTLLSTARGVSDVFKNSLNIPKSGSASLGAFARPDTGSAMRLPSVQNPANFVRSRPNSDIEASASLQKPQFTREPSSLRQATEDADGEFSKSQNYTQETCDICNCLMKYVPNDVVDGKFIMTKPRINLKPNLLRNIKLPNLLPNKKKSNEDEDLVAMASELNAVYASPPEHFEFTEGETKMDDSLWDEIDASDTIKKLTDFLNVVDRVDQFVSEKTKLVIKRLTEMTKDNQNS